MTTLDDKLLGEKLQNYCSSSESEDGEKILIQNFFFNIVEVYFFYINRARKPRLKTWS